MLRVLVTLSSKRSKLTIIVIGITHKPTSVPKAIAAADGQPTSTTSRWMFQFVTIACAAPDSEPHINPITRLMPTKAIPIVIPARRALPGFAPKINATIKIMMGRTTVAPRLSITDFKVVRKTSMILTPFFKYIFSNQSSKIFTICSITSSFPIPVRNARV